MSDVFIEERLLDKIAYGSEFGREFNTRVVQLRSGRERRNADWSAPLGRYSLLYQVIEPADHALVVNAHAACFGSLVGFRFKDWSDYTAELEFIGVASAGEQTMQLKKSYTFGPLSYERIISKPVLGQVTIYADEVEIPATVNTVTGEVTFTASAGQVITWSGEFDVPVRFADDRLDIQPITRRQDGYLLSADVDLVEVRV